MVDRLKQPGPTSMRSKRRRAWTRRCLVSPSGEDMWIVTLEGEYDLANAEQVDEALERAFDAGSTLILDLRPATFIDSIVIGKIAHARLRADGSRGTHRLAVVVDRYSHTARISS